MSNRTIKAIKQANKKAIKKTFKKEEQLIMNVAENLCKKPFRYRWLFCKNIMKRKNPFTGEKVKRRIK